MRTAERGIVELGHPVRDLGVPHQERLLRLIKLVDFADETSPVRLEPIALGPAGALPYLPGRLETGAGVAQVLAGLVPCPKAALAAVQPLRSVPVVGVQVGAVLF
jgi:hypothetical protein